MYKRQVQTYVFEHDWNVIADAIRRELSRGGQVYYLHNRVDSISAVAARINRMVPEDVYKRQGYIISPITDLFAEPAPQK